MTLEEGCKRYLDVFLERGTVAEQIENIEEEQL